MSPGTVGHDGKLKKGLWPCADQYENVIQQYENVNSKEYLSNCIQIALCSAEIFSTTEINYRGPIEGSDEKIDFNKLKLFTDTHKNVGMIRLDLLSGKDVKNRKSYRPPQIFGLKRGIYLLFVSTNKGCHHVYTYNAYKRVVYLGENKLKVIENDEIQTMKGLFSIANSLGITTWESVYLIVDIEGDVNGEKVYPLYGGLVNHKEIPKK